MRFDADIALAHACLAGDPAAMARFEREVLGPALRSVRDSRLTAASRDELRQRVRVHLLSGEEAKLARYGGKAPLLSWVRVVARRQALNMLAAARADEPLDARADGGADGHVVERLFAARYGDVFKRALATSIRSLPKEQRLALRLRSLFDLGVDQIAAQLGLSRATAARRVQDARASALTKLKARVARELGMSDSEIDSAIRSLRVSQLVDLREIFTP